MLAETPKEHKHTNHLASAASPYLLQHAHNPVNWYPWGDEAFEKAAKEDKPIFLGIGYAACHWCHVMERESFENEAIAAIFNEHFVAIKVDREERPDVDEIYMAATVAMSERGGWPKDENAVYVRSLRHFLFRCANSRRLRGRLEGCLSIAELQFAPTRLSSAVISDRVTL